MPLHIVRNDITKMQVDAIVNAANESLLGGGGVDGCIHRAAGPELLAECRTLGGCRVGQAKITGGYRLPCRYVIHTVGPRWHGGDQGEPELLRACYQNALALAEANACETVAFPLISSGVFGYPKDKALQVAVEAIGAFLEGHEMTVYLVIFDRKAYQIGETLFADIAAYIDDQYVEEHTDDAELRRRRSNAFFEVWSEGMDFASLADAEEGLDDEKSDEEEIGTPEAIVKPEDAGRAGNAEKPGDTGDTAALYEIDDLLCILNRREDATEAEQSPAPASPAAAPSVASGPTESPGKQKLRDAAAPSAVAKPSGQIPPPPARRVARAARRAAPFVVPQSGAVPPAAPPASALQAAPPAPMAAPAQQMAPAMPSMAPAEHSMLSLDEELMQLDESFSEMLLRKIDEAGITDTQCYKKANIDRKLFSKIRSDKLYRPSKPTALAFAIALELPLAETREMLEKAGFALSRSSKFDIIVEYFIRHGNYNVFEINEALFAFDQNLLGA